MKKLPFLLNLVVILAVSLAAGFFISTKVYYDQWQNMMLQVEELLAGKRFNLVEGSEKKESLSENMVFNFNSQIFLVAQKRETVSKNVLDQAYFNDDFLASAIVITNDGWLITATDLKYDQDLVVITNEKDVVLVQELVFDPVLGLTYLKIDKNNLNPVAIVNSDNLKPGETIYAVKPNYYNYQHEIIDNSIRNLHSRLMQKRADLVYNPADFSYGSLNNYIEDNLALFNNKSQFIGFSFNLEDQTYLLPSKYVIYSFTNFFKEEQQIIYPSLNIKYVDLSELVLNSDYLSKGAYVYEVLDQKSNLKIGDIITHIENDEINEIRSLNEILLDYQINDEINISLIRNGGEKKLKVIIQSGKDLIK